MAERTGYWNGPGSWAGPVDDADPTSGRHAFDRDAALTPIFTTLRRTARRTHLRPVPRDGWGPGPDHRRDPQTAPIPVVRPLQAVDPYLGVPVVPPESPNETTTWWRSPVGFPPVPARGEQSGGHRIPPADPVRPTPHPRPAPVAWAHDPEPPHTEQWDAVGGPDDGGYDAGYETAYDAGYDSGVRYDAVRYDAGYHDDRYDVAPRAAARPPLAVGPDALPAPTRYDPGPQGLPHVRAPYDPAPRRWAPTAGHDPNRYDPVTDTGRHHHRLAPAGW